jgi:predicted RNA-binding Zn-ribbon protein involved in translation (DUF1610 family)
LSLPAKNKSEATLDFKQPTMEIKRRTEILIETSRQIVVGDSESSEHFTCPQCGNQMVTAEHAAILLAEPKRKELPNESNTNF